MKINTIELMNALKQVPRPRFKGEVRYISVLHRVVSLNCSKSDPEPLVAYKVKLTSSVYKTGGSSGEWYEWDIDICDAE